MPRTHAGGTALPDDRRNTPTEFPRIPASAALKPSPGAFSLLTWARWVGLTVPSLLLFAEARSALLACEKWWEYL